MGQNDKGDATAARKAELKRAVAAAKKAARAAQAAAKAAQRASDAVQVHAVPQGSAASTGDGSWDYATVQDGGGGSLQVQTVGGTSPSLENFLAGSTAVRIEVLIGEDRIDAAGVAGVQAALLVFLLAFQGRTIKVASCQSTNSCQNN